MSRELVLHHYDLSPFSEPVRRALGRKGVRWGSVGIHPLPPRPKQLPLTGGYRRTPVLQIGADVYCDSQLIFQVLEARFPQPTLFPTGWRLLHNTLTPWVTRFTIDVVKLRYATWGDGGPDLFNAFIDDRRRMGIDPFDLASIQRDLDRLRSRMESFAAWINDQLATSGDYLLGSEPSVVDLRAAQGFWFLDAFVADARPEFERHARLRAWTERLQAIGHGDRHETSDDSALAVGTTGEPDDIEVELDETAGGFAAHALVTVRADDYGFEPTAGELLKLTRERISVLRHDEQAGAIAVHFPRYGFVVERTERP